jgi:hypothetical protein
MCRVGHRPLFWGGLSDGSPARYGAPLRTSEPSGRPSADRSGLTEPLQPLAASNYSTVQIRKGASVPRPIGAFRDRQEVGPGPADENGAPKSQGRLKLDSIPLDVPITNR